MSCSRCIMSSSCRLSISSESVKPCWCDVVGRLDDKPDGPIISVDVCLWEVTATTNSRMAKKMVICTRNHFKPNVLITFSNQTSKIVEASFAGRLLNMIVEMNNSATAESATSPRGFFHYTPQISSFP